VPPWDHDLGIESEWMSWSDVRDLRGMGFELGAHTINHVDLGEVHGAEAREEISESRAQLESQTRAEVRSFSYPFGGSQHFTEENRELVRDLGFDCCLSAFGGAVREDTDPFRLPRLPVSHWYRSPAELGFEIALSNNRRA
jgi:peptidoglycan/xylan/chitin deacetylase (PgdA/CDA1 family)